MRTLDQILGWLLIAFGIVHASLTRKVHPNLDIDAVWFACGGLFIALIGIVNILRVAYAGVAKGVYVASVVANFVLLGVMLFIATLLPVRSNPQVLTGLVLAALITAFSLLRRQS